MTRHRWPNGRTLKWFRPSEFDRPEEMDFEFLERLDALRSSFGKGILITSDFRTEHENEHIGGFHNSPHLRGKAVDCQPIPFTPENKMHLVSEVLDLWREGQFPRLGLGIYNRHIHIDQDTDLRRPFLFAGKSK